jgi:long-chain fatty acid transport protein
VGVGFNYIISNVLFYQVIDLPSIPLAPGVALPAAPNVGVNLEGDGKGAYTFNVGILFKPTEDLSFGASYRHEAEIEFNGDLTFSNLPEKPTGFPVGHADLFPNGTGIAKLTMPYDFRFGLSYDAMDDLTFNADFQLVGWSSYKELAVDFANETAAWKDLKTPKNWDNAYSFKFGGEYRIDEFALRAGYVFDANPIPTMYMDPSLPGGNRHEFTVGVGYQITKNLRADVAYQFISFENNVKDSALPQIKGFPVMFNGVYKNLTNLFGVNLGYNL